MSLVLGINDHILRNQLGEITKPADAAELKAQVQQMASLALRHPHTVTLHEENIPGSRRFNCYQYSFGVADVCFREGGLEVFPGRHVVQVLINDHLEEIGPGDVEDGDHIIYSAVQIEHAAKAQSGAIESKWGTGHIWRHGVYEVPDNYGDTVHFYRHFPRESVLQALHELGFQASTLP